MRKKILFLMVLLSLSTLTLNAQIAIRDSKVVENAIIKPQRFDSLSNIELQRIPINYKKYIGYKLYFLPRSSKFTSDENREIDFLFTNKIIQQINIETPRYQTNKTQSNESKIKKAAFGILSDKLKGIKQVNDKVENAIDKRDNSTASIDNSVVVDLENTDVYKPLAHIQPTSNYSTPQEVRFTTIPDSVEGKYFTIIDIKARDYHSDSKEYKNLEDDDFSRINPSLLMLKIALRNDTNNDTLYWKIRADRLGEPFFLVPFFEKQKKLYLNQNLVLRDKDKTYNILEDMVDVNTGEVVSIKYGEVWTCTDISFVELKDSYYLEGFYFLKNGNKEVKIAMQNNRLDDFFMLESEFNKNKEEEIKAEQEREKQEELKIIKFRKDCIAKWGQKIGSYVAEGKVIIGMNKEMCSAAWGSPIDKNKTIVRGLTSEQWVYGWGAYLYFENGILKVIQN